MIDVAVEIFGPLGRWFVSAAAFISMGGTMIAASFITPRSGEAIAQDGVIPRKFAEKNRFGAPYLAILITLTVTVALALYGNFIQLATIGVLARATQYLPTSIAVLIFRTTKERFLQGRWRILVALLATGSSLWLIAQAPSQQLFFGFILLALLTPAYFLRQALRSRQAA